MARFLRFFAGFSIFAPLCAGAGAVESASELARRIAARLRPQEAIRLQVRALGGADDPKPVEAALTQSLRARLRGGAESPAVRVTLSRSWESNLLVAEIVRTEGTTVLMLPYESGLPAAARFAASLEKRLLWSQSARLLDVLAVDGGLLVLDERGVSFRGNASEIAHEQPWPRDLRGRLAVREGGFDAFLPGVSCQGTIMPEWRVECSAQDRPWPLGSAGEAVPVTGRNHFSHAKFGAMFTAAVLGEAAVVAAADGPVKVVRGAGTTPVPGLGSDLSAIPDPCGQGELLLASDPEGATLTLHRLGAQGFAPASQPLEMGGPITALWGDTAIVRNGANGGYAAYRVSASCSR